MFRLWDAWIFIKRIKKKILEENKHLHFVIRWDMPLKSATNLEKLRNRRRRYDL